MATSLLSVVFFVCTLLLSLCSAAFHGAYYRSSVAFPVPNEDYHSRFTEFVFEREDNYLSFSDGNWKLPSNFGFEYFGVIWTGYLSIPKTGNYTFRLETDDGAQLYIRDTLTINGWLQQPTTTYLSSMLPFQAGELVELKIVYFQYSGSAVINFKWRGPGFSNWEFIGGDAVSESLHGWRGEYFLSDGQSKFANLQFARKDSYIDISAASRSFQLPSDFPPEYFAIRWNGTLIVPTTGNYQFHVTIDDGFKFYIDNTLFFSNWDDGPSRTFSSNDVWFQKGQTVELSLEMYNAGGDFVTQLKWKGPNISQVLLGGDAISTCGNHLIEQYEECDGGFACTNCKCDFKYHQFNPPQLGCQPGCGDEQVNVEEDEVCDGGVGCTENCTCATGFVPTNPLSVNCQKAVEGSNCSNGRVDVGEECDGGFGCLNCTCVRPGFVPSKPFSLDCIEVIPVTAVPPVFTGTALPPQVETGATSNSKPLLAALLSVLGVLLFVVLLLVLLVVAKRRGINWRDYIPKKKGARPSSTYIPFGAADSLAEDELE